MTLNNFIIFFYNIFMMCLQMIVSIFGDNLVEIIFTIVMPLHPICFKQKTISLYSKDGYLAERVKSAKQAYNSFFKNKIHYS